MTMIGPNLAPTALRPVAPADAAAKAQMARALFFQAMTNTAAVAPASEVQPAAPPPPIQAAAPQPAEDAQPRLRRPGSLLNILV